MPLIPESLLLRPHDPSLHSDDWPILPLTHVEVFHPADPSTPVSLLDADAHTALTITARLGQVPSELSHTLVSDHKSGALTAHSKYGPEIVIDEVRHFAYGQYEDGKIEVWAAGKAGWFSIKPARAYKQVYRDIIEAIDMLYMAGDMYSAYAMAGNKKGKNREGVVGPSEEAVFESWAARKRLPARIEGARAVAERHRRFLMSSMLVGKEGIEWTRTPMFKYFQENFPVRSGHLHLRPTG